MIRCSARLLLTPMLIAGLMLAGCNSSSGDTAGSGDTGGDDGGGSSGADSVQAVATVRLVMGTAYLDGSASYPSVTSYQWQQTAGTPVTLSDPTAARPEFTIPAVATGEILTFQLTVMGADDASDEQLISLEVTPENQPTPRSALVGPAVVGETLAFPDSDGFVIVHDLVKIQHYLYLSAGESGVRYVDVSDPQAPEVIGSIGAIDRVRGLALNDRGDVLYMADHEGIRVVDVSDPGQPTVLTSLLSFIVDHDAYAVFARGDRLYAAGEDLVVYDVSDPAAPVIDARFQLPFNNIVISDLVVANDLAYVLLAQGGLRIFALNESDTPELVGSYSIDDHTNDMWLTGPLLYIATDDQGVITVDVSDPSLPGYVGSMTESNSLYPNRAQSIEVFGDHAYVGGAWSLQAWDIDEPAQANFLGEVVSAGDAVTVDGQFAYVASGEFVAVVDISRPESLSVLSERTDLDSFNTSASGGFIRLGDTMAVLAAGNPATLNELDTGLDTQGANYRFVEDDRLYVVGAELSVFDVSTIASPSLITTYALDDINFQFVYVNVIVDADDDRLFFIDTQNQVTVLDVSDADNPTLIRPDFSGSGYQLLAVEGNIAFVSKNNGQTFSAVNFSNPDNLTEIASLDVTDRDYVSLGGKALRVGDHLVVSGRLSSRGDGLAIFDVSTPASPSLVAYPRESDNLADNLTVLGNLVFLTEGQNLNGYVMMYDLSDPAHPVYTTLTPEGMSRYYLQAAGNTLLVDEDRVINQIKTHVVDIGGLLP